MVVLMSACGTRRIHGELQSGAVVGAVLMQRARALWSAEVVVSSGIAVYGVATLAAGLVRLLPLLCAATFIGGASWIMFIAIMNVMVLNRSPKQPRRIPKRTGCFSHWAMTVSKAVRAVAKNVRSPVGRNSASVVHPPTLPRRSGSRIFQGFCVFAMFSRRFKGKR